MWFPSIIRQLFKKQVAMPVSTNAKCPKCRSTNLSLIEIRDDERLIWSVKKGEFDKSAYTKLFAKPVRVEGRCAHCDWEWTLRKAGCIEDLDKSKPEPEEIPVFKQTIIQDENTDIPQS